MRAAMTAEIALRPADVRTSTRVTARASVPNVVHVRTVDWPERAAFLARIDELMTRENFRHDSALAEAAGISHTALSNWRKGKVKPSFVSITAVAKALNAPPNQLAALAGLLSDNGEVTLPEPLPDEFNELIAYYRLIGDEDHRADIRKQVRIISGWIENTMLPQPRRRAG